MFKTRYISGYHYQARSSSMRSAFSLKTTVT